MLVWGGGLWAIASPLFNLLPPTKVCVDGGLGRGWEDKASWCVWRRGCRLIISH